MREPQTATILVVDDSVAEVRLLQEGLRAIGSPIRLHHAGDADAALGHIDGESFEPPAIVLLDLNMPGMDGLSFLRVFRDDERFGAVPVYILSGSTAAADVLQSRELRANGFLRKPFGFDETCELARRLDAHVRTGAPLAVAGHEF